MSRLKCWAESARYSSTVRYFDNWRHSEQNNARPLRDEIGRTDLRHIRNGQRMDLIDRLFAINAKGAFFTLRRAARHIADNGRILYVGSSTTAFATPGHGLYSGSKIAAQFLVEVLAKEIGSRGVTVNSILPTAIEGAGVYTEGASEDVMQFERSFRPIRRMGTLDDVANAAEYLASDLADFISGQHLLLSGGGPA